MAGVIGALDRSGDPVFARRLEPAIAGIAQMGFSAADLFSRSVADRMGDVMADQSPGGGAIGREGFWGQIFASSQQQESPDNQDGWRLNIGVKLTLAARGSLIFSLGYDFETKGYFSGHADFMQARYLF
jgi:hypothetical protein